jgi:hypothetical protein
MVRSTPENMQGDAPGFIVHRFGQGTVKDGSQDGF